MSRRLEGRVALVTGGGRGIGRAITERFASEGATVVVAQRSLDEATVAAEEVQAAGGAATAVELDVRDEDSVVHAADHAVATHGGVDILCNNAGTGVARSVVDLDRAEYDVVMETNVLGTMLCAKHLLPQMGERGGGSIVNLSSVAGLAGLEANAPYCASKGALVALTMQMALDAAPAGVRVNCIVPGFVETRQMRDFLESRPDPAAAEAAAVALHPLGRLGRPDDVAGAAAFLASDDAAFVTGAALVVDGGYLAR